MQYLTCTPIINCPTFGVKCFDFRGSSHFTLTMVVNGRLCVPTGKISDTLWSSMAVSKMRRGLRYCLHLILYIVIADFLFYST